MIHVKSKVLALLVVFIGFNSSTIFGQYDSQFEKLTIKDGLSSNDIWSTVQDQYGFLWIATKDGLNVYDGYNFKIYKNISGDSTSLPSSDCNVVYEDSNHDIWVGTKVGLVKFNRDNETFVNYQFSKNNGNQANSVWKILEDARNNLWITSNDGPIIFDRDKDEFVKFDIMRFDNTLGAFSTSASSIVQTKMGDLYFGSNYFGLVKFDYSSQIFIQQNVNNGTTLLKYNNIMDMYEDKEGNLWLATQRGLLVVDLRNMTLKDVTPYKKFEGSENDLRKQVVGVYKDRYNNMWIGTSTNGIYVYETKKGEFQSIYTSSSTNYIGPFYEDRFGIIWVCTTHGLWKYDLDKKPFDLVMPSNVSDDESDPIILSFAQTQKFDRKMWLGSSSGLYLFDMNTRKMQASSDLLNKINSPEKLSISSLVDDHDNLWVGSDTKGIFKLNLTSNKISNFKSQLYDHNSISVDRILTLADSKDNRIWVGTAFGINIIDKSTNKISSVSSLVSRHYDDKLSQSIYKLSQSTQPVVSILQVGDFADISKNFVLTQDENIIISSLGEGLFQWNMVDYGWLESETGDTIWSHNDLYSTFHAGGDGKNRIKIGMMKLKKGRYKLKYISDDSHSTQSFNAQPPEDTLSWGIAMYSLTDDDYDHLEKILIQDDSTTYLDGHVIRKLILSSDNTIWAATNLGLSRIDSKTFAVKNYRKHEYGSNSLSSDLVNDIVEDMNGKIWIATEDGLNKLDSQTGEFILFGEKNGLPTNNLKSIQVDNAGDLWVGSSNGVSKIEISAGYENPIIINYDVKDGLQGYDFIAKASFKDSDGRLYFSGTEGFNVFLPGKSNNTLPYVALNNVLISNKSIRDIDSELLKGVTLNQISELDLPHDQNDLSFEFASIHYSRPDKNRLMYKMDGVDEDWVLSDRRFATYTNLDPGEYVFNIKGSNGDGIWNDAIRKINISISPPWYNNWTAYSIYSAIFLGLLFGVRKFEMVRQKKNAQIKESQLELEATKLKAEAAEAKAQVVQAENERKTKELEEARSLQLSMLPKELPQLPNLDIAVYMKTATEVGGDYYDFHIGLDGTLTVVLGDATGHGMKAGTMVTTTKSLFNVLAPNPNIIETFHEMTRCLKLMHMQNLSMCMTMIKIMGNKLQMSAAGMPPVFLYKRENQSTEEHVIKGMPLGTFSNFPYQVVESSISSGDTILLMSDGFPELLNDNKEMYGYKRARNFFEEIAGETPGNIISKLKDAGSDWVNDKDPDDDVTFVVIKVK